MSRTIIIELSQDCNSQSVIQSGDILASEKLLLKLDLPINSNMINRVIVPAIFSTFCTPLIMTKEKPKGGVKITVLLNGRKVPGFLIFF